ncbi:MAG: acyl-CoA dehydrogenase family protein [Planctomycetes bacterium]|nr:acyl-CoA dehydrogenase family protein [Planctomycetota bacterium]
MNEDLVLPDSDLSPELREFALQVRDFAHAKLAPHARRIDEERTFRAESVAELANEGMLGGTLSPDVGGSGWSPLQRVVAHEEIGAVCGNTRGFLAVHTGLVASTIERYGNAEQRERWLGPMCRGDSIGCFGLTEPDAGSDVASLACHAEPTDDGYRLTGQKIWITNGGIADVILLFATLDPSKGKDGISAFLVESHRNGIRRTRMPGVDLGHRGSDHARIKFDNVEIPGDALVGSPGQGFEIAMAGLHAGRLSVAAGAVGIHRAALACSIAFANKREQFGRPIAKFQMVQERLADMTVELIASRQIVHRCARRRMEGIETAGDLAAAKLYSTEAAARAADQAVMLHGGRGYSSEFPAERLLRDIMGLRIYEGTTMIQKAILGRAVLG